MKDKKRRTLMKSITWRILATLTTIIGFFILTGDVSLAISGGLSINLIKGLMYYGHERVWENIAWGRH